MRKTRVEGCGQERWCLEWCFQEGGGYRVRKRLCEQGRYHRTIILYQYKINNNKDRLQTVCISVTSLQSQTVTPAMLPMYCTGQ